MKTLYHFIFCSALVLNHMSSASTFETEQWQTKNGVRVIFYPAQEVPMLDVNLAFAAGSAYDSQHFGLSALTTQLINQGNGNLDAGQIAEKIEKTGAQFKAQTSRDMVILSLRTLSRADALKDATDTFRLIINNPNFSEDTFVREQNQQLLSIKQVQDSPEEVANQTFFKTLYQNHPYAHPIIGDSEHVKALTTQHVKNFYHQHFVSANAVLVMVGAIDSTTAHQLADKLVSDLPKGKPAPPLPEAPPLKKSETLHTDFPSSQTMLRIGQLGITHHNANYFPLVVGNHILGGGSLVSILAIELREKRGLTYGVYSQFTPMPGVGPFIISLSTRNDQATEANQLIRDILSAYTKNGPTAEELRASKQYLIGGFPLSLASNQSIAEILLKIAFYHLPEDYLNTYVQHINEVTAEDVKSAFQKQIAPDALLEVSVGK